MTRLFTYAGIAASVILIAFGVGAIYTGFDGRDQVRGDLAREQIVGTPDSSIPGQKVDTGSEAQAFAKVMRKHTLEATELGLRPVRRAGVARSDARRERPSAPSG